MAERCSGGRGIWQGGAGVAPWENRYVICSSQVLPLREQVFQWQRGAENVLPTQVMRVVTPPWGQDRLASLTRNGIPALLTPCQRSVLEVISEVPWADVYRLWAATSE